NDLFERNIRDEEEIPSTIDIQSDSIMDLDNDINESLSEELDNAERNSESNNDDYTWEDSGDNTL
ncbi:12500_t:CDS:2, partial [Cetraspora pellucida]